MSASQSLTRPNNDQWSDSGPIIKHIQLFCPSPPDYLQTHKDCMSTRAGCGRSFWTSCPVGGLRSGPPAPSTSRDPTRAQLLTRPTLFRWKRRLILWRKMSGWSFGLRGVPGSFTFLELNRSLRCFTISAIYDYVHISCHTKATLNSIRTIYDSTIHSFPYQTLQTLEVYSQCCAIKSKIKHPRHLTTQNWIKTSNC